jgi:hypothetical protein
MVWWGWEMVWYGGVGAKLHLTFFFEIIRMRLHCVWRGTRGRGRGERKRKAERERANERERERQRKRSRGWGRGEREKDLEPFLFVTLRIEHHDPSVDAHLYI